VLGPRNGHDCGFSAQLQLERHKFKGGKQHGYKEKGSKKEEALTSRIREPSCEASRKKHLSRGFLLCGA
jgi:hypothetical protein